ncbi:MAG TPA: carbon-nitrogen hydrolase family protein [Pyrinomonadaceae bacterium]|jgi:predicted amidohydrolase|nr:carbon-nitrogen hydrolase family protein [Pyrinomonadaceae bacterium]
MSPLNVALLQMTPCGDDEDANLSKGEAFCRRARAAGADIALFPEMWNVGHTFFDPAEPGGRERWQARAVGPEDQFVRHFRALAAELNMAIALTYLERWPVAPRNSVSLIDRRGEVSMTYAKVHTCDFGSEAALTPGDEFRVCALDTACGEVRVGTMICYDREFPESARVLMLRGAEIILTPNACTLDPTRIGQFRARAYENMVGVAMTNYAAPRNNGHSVAFDAVACTGPHADGSDGEARDTLIVEAGEREGIYLAPFDLEELRAYRRRETWGNAYRRPRCYAPLVSPEVHEPFIRHDARR